MKYLFTGIMLLICLILLSNDITNAGYFFGVFTIVSFIVVLLKNSEKEKEENTTSKISNLKIEPVIIKKSLNKTPVLDTKKVLIDKIKKITISHEMALASEREKYIYKDPYGNDINDKWISLGVTYFFKSTILCKLTETEKNELKWLNNSFYQLTNKQSNSEKPPQEIIDLIERIAKSAQKKLLKITNFSESLNGVQYEKMCGRILEKEGWEIKYTKGSGDQGVDIIAKFNNKILAIQCKKHMKPVGNKGVQEIIAGKVFYKTHHAAVIASHGFTPSAVQLASKSQVILISHNEIENLKNNPSFMIK